MTYLVGKPDRLDLRRRRGSGQQVGSQVEQPCACAWEFFLCLKLKRSHSQQGLRKVEGMENTEQAFEEFWNAKPRRKGSNPKDQARLKFLRAVANGCDPQKIVGAAREWKRIEIENEKEGTEFVAMASTWLNQRRFEDYKQRSANDRQAQIEFMRSKGYEWRGESEDVGNWVKVA